VHGVAQLVGAVRCKPEGRGFIVIFHDIIRSSQPLTEMRTRNISWSVKTAGA